MSKYTEHLFQPLNEISFKSPIMSNILKNAENRPSLNMPECKNFPDTKSYIEALKNDDSTNRSLDFQTRVFNARNRSSFNQNQRDLAKSIGYTGKPKTWFDFKRNHS